MVRTAVSASEVEGRSDGSGAGALSVGYDGERLDKTLTRPPKRGGSEQSRRAFKLVSNPANALIISALMGAESHPRELAQKLEMLESHVSERLRALEELGLVRSRWARVANPEKNVKVYSSTISSLRVDLDAGGMRLETTRAPGSRLAELAQPYYGVTIPKVSTFVGRKKELDTLQGEATGLTVVTGIAGIGKTALVAKYAGSTGRRFDGVFWHDLRESDSLRYVLAKLGRFLDRRGPGRLSKLIQSGASEEGTLIDAAVDGLRGGRFLVVFDDYHFCRDSGVTRLARRLADSRAARTVVVSRTRPTELYLGSGLVPELNLSGHTEAEARKLFEENGVRLERGEIARINTTLRGHPLGLTLACRSVKAMGKERALDVALSRVRDHVLFWIVNVLEGGELGTLRSLSVLRGPFPLGAARMVELGGVREDVLLQRMTALEKAGAVTTAGGRFAVHDVVREAVAAQFPGSLAGAHARAASYYESAGDRRSSLEAIYHFVKAGLAGEALSRYFSNDGFTRISDEGYAEPLLRLSEELLAGIAPSLEGESRVRGWLMVVRGFLLYRTQKSYALALRSARDAEGIAGRCGDRVLLAASLLNQANVLSALGNTRGAERACRHGLAVPGIESEGPTEAAYLMESMADLMATEGRFEEAIRFGSSAVGLFQKSGDSRNIAGSMGGLAVYRYMTGDLEEAISLLRRARAEAPAGNKMISEFIEEATGLVMERAGKKREALLHLNRGIRLAKESGNRHVLLEVVSERILLRCKLGDLAGAKRETDEAAELGRMTERKYSLGIFELAWVGLSVVRRDNAEISSHLRKAGRLLSDDAVSRGRVEWWRGVVDAHGGRLASARRHLARAKRQFEDMGADGYARQVASVRAKLEASPPKNTREALALVW
ncbi:MAG: tetratricopeptide repeat protein [Nitrososphaerota archaeon]|nr:tetratricopeptide repeat protein [Nitrososphaerota archaeon]